MTFVVHHTDCLVYLKTLSDNTIDSVVTDPPYGLGFMGKNWDKALPNPEIWKECLRVLKPGGHMVVFGAPRLYHRLTCQIEDAGFEVRDQLLWVFGSGFPKSLDVSKAIDAAAGAVREVVGFDASAIARQNKQPTNDTQCTKSNPQSVGVITAPATPDAARWSGWGTALKPAYEPILLVRKPLMGTVAANVLKYGTGGINIDGCRIGETKRVPGSLSKTTARNSMSGPMMSDSLENSGHNENIGRWPANVILDPEAGVLLDEQTGVLKSGVAVQRNGGGQRIGSERTYTGYDGDLARPDAGYSDKGGASRFFYCAKTSKSEREAGLGGTKDERQNNHPTVKPISLMRWLVKMVTPSGGTVLDPFTGSGSTGCAAVQEGSNFVGCELEEEYVNIARLRIEASKMKNETPKKTQRTKAIK